MSCNHSSKPCHANTAAKKAHIAAYPSKHTAAGSSLQTGSFAVAGTPKPCHANAAAKHSSNQHTHSSLSQLCRSRHCQTMSCNHSSIPLPLCAIMSLRTKQIWPHTVGTMMQPVCETTQDSCKHISSSRQAYSCSQMTTCDCAPIRSGLVQLVL